MRGEVRSGRRAWALAGAVVVVVLGAPSVLAADVGGAEQWVARDFGSGHDTSAGMAVSPDGATVYVAGSSSGEFAVAARVARTGAERWVFRGSDPRDLSDFAAGIAVSPDGALVFVTGDAEVTVDTRNFVTVAIDAATGDMVWSARESIGEHREALADFVAVSPDGARLFVTGAREGTGGIDDFWDYSTVAYDATSGDTLWTATYRGPGIGADVPSDLGVSLDGTRVYVTGTSVGDGTGRDYATVAYDAGDGSRLWVARDGTDGDDYAEGLVSSPGGDRVYVTGNIRTFSGASQDIGTVAHDSATGNRIGAMTFDSGSVDWAGDVAVGPGGSLVFVTGEGSADFATVAYSSLTGRELWSARYGSGPGEDVAVAVAVAPDGRRVYVTGTFQNDRLTCGFELPSSDYATVAYSSLTGRRLWSARYAGLAKDDPDLATEVAVSPDGGSVFVTGTSDTGCAVPDVATLSYEA